MFEVNIYLETSLKGPGTRAGWYAAVVEYQTKHNGTKTREIFEYDEAITYHKSALRAFAKSLKILNKECNLTIYTDSVYLISSFQNHLTKWEENGYKNAKGEDIKNQDEWQQISKLKKRHNVTFIQIKRHSYSMWMMEEAKKRLKIVDNYVENTENLIH